MRRLPVIVVTGFLGSGKTTLINRLLSDARLADTAVIVNEFGTIPLDHLLVREAIADTLVLAGGCVCCTSRGDLVDTLADLHERAARGEVPRFSRVLVETTGLAEPAPIVQSVATRNVASAYRLHGFVTTVDAMNGARQLLDHPEAARQVAAAGLIVLTKTDIAGDVAGLTAALRRVNPAAPLISAADGTVGIDAILAAVTQYMPGDDCLGWLPDPADCGPSDEPATAFPTDHVSAVSAIPLVRDAPVPWPMLYRWMQSLLSLRGHDVLRLKGLVNVSGRHGPRVVHGIQHLLHPPRDLAAWPDQDERTRIVVIGRNLGATGVTRSFVDTLAGLPHVPPPR